VEALILLVAGLPRSIRAAIIVVLHVPPDAPSALAEILRRSGAVPALQVDCRQRIKYGQIYVAPPNRHLVLDDGHVHLEAGPRENRARPAVDVLFRSAARVYGSRVVGIILSGALRDGAEGMAAIKMGGGITIVQDPDEALFAGMPQSALKASAVDYCVQASLIPRLLVRLTRSKSASAWTAAMPS
jgi:two-component system chemotaxis response regulator CheB